MERVGDIPSGTTFYSYDWWESGTDGTNHYRPLVFDTLNELFDPGSTVYSLDCGLVNMGKRRLHGFSSQRSTVPANTGIPYRRQEGHQMVLRDGMGLRPTSVSGEMSKERQRFGEDHVGDEV